MISDPNGHPLVAASPSTVLHVIDSSITQDLMHQLSMGNMKISAEAQNELSNFVDDFIFKTLRTANEIFVQKVTSSLDLPASDNLNHGELLYVKYGPDTKGILQRECDEKANRMMDGLNIVNNTSTSNHATTASSSSNSNSNSNSSSSSSNINSSGGGLATTFNGGSHSNGFNLHGRHFAEVVR